MIEYIPTTEDVRSNYEEARCSYFGVSGNRFGEEFDRWLAGVKADAWQEGWSGGAEWPQNFENPYGGGQA